MSHYLDVQASLSLAPTPQHLLCFASFFCCFGLFTCPKLFGQARQIKEKEKEQVGKMVTVDVMGESGLGLVRCCLLAVGEPLMLGQGRLQ